VKKFSIPSKFELINSEEIHNTNFKKVKLYIQSDGINYNGSSFTVDSMRDAMRTIDYIPILGYVKNNGEIYDFDGHNISYDIHVDNNGNTSIVENFDEVPIGVVTSKDCHIEYVNEKNFLVAYGYIWKSYSNRGIEILERDIEKEVSMEISVFDGDFDDDGVFAISKYEIHGVTVLGQDVPAAIEGSKIQMSFSRKDNEYENKLKEIDKLLTQFNLKGGEVMEEKEMQQEFEQQEQPQEEVEQPQEFAEEVKDEEVCEECGKNPCECEEEEKEEEFAKEDEEENVEEEVEEKEEEKKYSQEELDNAIANTRAEYSQLIEELETLREFKAEYDKQVKEQQLNDEMDNIVANFNVEDELVKELKEKVINGEYSMEKFELELFRNNTPVKKEFNKKESNKLPVIDNEVKMTDVDHFFASYGVNKK
jgi:hypothetical protein